MATTDERIVRFRVGVMVIATFFVLAILIVLFGDLPSFVRGSYTVYIKFPEAPGVTQDTPVRKSGILIGRVTEVKFAEDDPRFNEDNTVIVTVGIDSDRRIRRSEICRITSSILGDAVLQFVPNKTGGAIRGNNEYIQDGDVITGIVSTDPLSLLSNLEGNLGQAIGSVSTAGREVSKLAGHIDSLLANNDEQIYRIISKTEASLDAFQHAVGGLDGVLGNEELAKNLQRALADLPKFLDDTRTTVNAVREVANTADRNLRNLEGFTRPLGQRGDSMVAKVDSTVARLDELLAQFTQFGKALNSSEGTFGQLLNNPDLYQHLNAAACNIEELTRELRPIIDDARVFSDKIARHPEVLGVRGAIKKSPGIK